VALDSHSKGSQSGSSGGSHEPFFSTDFPTLRRNPDSKFKEKTPSTPPPSSTSHGIDEVPPKRSSQPRQQQQQQRQPDNYEISRSRDSLSMSSSTTTAKDASGGGSQHRQALDSSYHHMHLEDHLAGRHAGISNAGRLFSGNMTPEELALVLEAAQAFVDPPERFSTKSKSSSFVHKHQQHSPACFAQNER